MSIKEGTMVIVKNDLGEEVIGEVRIVLKELGAYMVKVPFGKGKGTEMVRRVVENDNIIN